MNARACVMKPLPVQCHLDAEPPGRAGAFPSDPSRTQPVQSQVPAILLLGLLLACLPDAVASPVAHHKSMDAGDFRRQTWTAAEGLPANCLQAILQTRDGFLWLGTPRGLVRFDGLRCEVFNHLNTPGMANDDCRALAQTTDGNLWVATRAGLLRFRDGQCQRLDTERGRLTEEVHLLLASNSGALWIGTSRGLYRWQEEVVTAFTVREGLADDWIGGMDEDDDGNLWVVTRWAVHRFDQSAQRLVPMWQRSGRPAELPSALHVDADGFWFLEGTQAVAGSWMIGALARQSPNRPLTLHLFPQPLDLVGRPGVLMRDRAGTLWCSAGRNGLYAFREGRFTHYGISNSLPDNWVLSLGEDREGNLWIGTESGGLQRWQPRRVRTIGLPDGLPHESTWTVCETRDGARWIGTDSGLTRLFAGQTVTLNETSGLPHNAVRALCEGADGGLWVGTGNGLCRYAEGRFRRQPLPGDLGGNKVRVICQSRDTALWVGTALGLHRLQDGECLTFTSTNGLPHDDVRALLEDREGRLWIGTFGGGLACLAGGQFRTYTMADGLPSDFAWALHEDQTGALWIGTENGLARGRAGRFTGFTTEQGLAENTINHILADDEGHLWLGGEEGIHRVSRAELEAVAERRRRTVNVATFDTVDGMVSAETNGQKSQPAGWRMRNGELWFPTTKGVAIIQPRSGVINDVPPPARILEVRADEEILLADRLQTNPNPRPGVEVEARNQDAEFTLAPGHGRVLEFHYTAPSFSAPEKVRFRYRLEGYDEDWHDVGPRRVAYYTNLRPGRYEFQVRAANHHGVWGGLERGFAFRLAPYFHQTVWFYLLVALGVAGCGYGAHRVRLRLARRFQLLEQQLAVERERARIARDLHDDLGASLTQISLVTELARRKLEATHPVQAEVRTLATAAAQANQSVDEIVWAVNPQNDTLRSLLAYLRNFTAEFLEAAGKVHRLSWPDDIPAWPVSAEIRHHIFLAAKEALNNAVQHAEASEVSVRVVLIDHRLRVELVDDGRGFSSGEPSQGGNGLTNMRLRIERLGGQFNVQTAIGEGTRVEFTVPLADSMSPPRPVAAQGLVDNN